MLRDLGQPSHLLILALIIAVLFGAKRLPDAARGLGRSMRIFKSEIKQMSDDTTTPAAPQSPAPLEGRVMDGDTQRATTPTEQRRDA